MEDDAYKKEKVAAIEAHLRAQQERAVRLAQELETQKKAEATLQAQQAEYLAKLDRNFDLLSCLLQPHEQALAADGIEIRVIKEALSWAPRIFARYKVQIEPLRKGHSWGEKNEHHWHYRGDGPLVEVFGAKVALSNDIVEASDGWVCRRGIYSWRSWRSATVGEGWNDPRDAAASILREVAFRMAEDPQDPMSDCFSYRGPITWSEG